jgi:hypothetical protein
MDVAKDDATRAALRAAPKAAASSAAPSAAAVPADVVALLSRLSLSSYGAALCGALGVRSAAALAFLTDADLVSIDMKPVERRMLLAAAAAPAAAPAAPAASSFAPAAPAGAPGACDVMLSYRVPETGDGGDRSVFALQMALQARGFSVFVGESAIEGGSNWPATIQKGVEDCKAFVVLCSPTYGDEAASPWTQMELVLAHNMKKPLLPVWHSGPYPPPAVKIYFSGKQRIPTGNLPEPDGYAKAGISHESVAEALAAALVRAGVAPARA